MSPEDMAAHLRALGWTVTAPAPRPEDLPPIQPGQLWVPSDPHVDARRITHVGEGGHVGMHGEVQVHFTAGERPETMQLGRHFLAWARLSGARPEPARGLNPAPTP